jgi:hypothetical protein
VKIKYLAIFIFKDKSRNLKKNLLKYRKKEKDIEKMKTR